MMTDSNDVLIHQTSEAQQSSSSNHSRPSPDAKSSESQPPSDSLVVKTEPVDSDISEPEQQILIPESERQALFDRWLTPKQQFRARELRSRGSVREERFRMVAAGVLPDISKYPRIEAKVLHCRMTGQDNEAAVLLKALEDWLAQSGVAPPWQTSESDSKDVTETIDLTADEPDIIDIETLVLEQLPSRIQVKTEAGSHTSARSDSKSHSNSHSKALSTNSLNGSHPASKSQSSVPSSVSNSPSISQSSNLKSQSTQAAKKQKPAKSVRSELPLPNLELSSSNSDSNSNSQPDFDSPQSNASSESSQTAQSQMPKPTRAELPSSFVRPVPQDRPTVFDLIYPSPSATSLPPSLLVLIAVFMICIPHRTLYHSIRTRLLLLSRALRLLSSFPLVCCATTLWF